MVAAARFVCPPASALGEIYAMRATEASATVQGPPRRTGGVPLRGMARSALGGA